MTLTIPTREDRIASYYKYEVALFTEAANNAIEYGSPQLDNKGHRYIVTRFEKPINGGVEDEFWDWLVATYDKAGWILEKVWGDEDTPEYGFLVGIEIYFKIQDKE